MRARRLLILALGCLWALDGVLQLQPAMFTGAFVANVLAPTLQGQPSGIANLITLGIHIWSAHMVLSNSIAALVQLLIGALLIFGRGREKMERFALWFSIAWAAIIWVFGEGMGILFTGSATFYTGAPGAALLYIILAAVLLFAAEKPSRLTMLPLAAGVILIGGALLNLLPMFWQPTMLSMLASIPQPSAWLGQFGSEGTMIGNLIAVDLLLFLGLLLVFLPRRPVAWVAIGFFAIVWAVGQNFGGIQTFPFGTATDPNAAPLMVLLLIPIFFCPEKDLSRGG